MRFAVVALKGQDSAAAAPWLERLQPEVVVVIQNGVEHEAHIDHPRLVPAIINTAVERVAPGHLIHRAGDLLTLADRPGAAEFAALLDGTALHDEARARLPDRRLAQAPDQPRRQPDHGADAAAAPRSSTSPAIRELARGLLSEAVAIGRAEGAATRVRRRRPDARVLRRAPARHRLLDALRPPRRAPAGDRAARRARCCAPLRATGLPAPRVQALYALLGALNG